MTHQAVGFDNVKRGLRRAQRFRFLSRALLCDAADRKDQNEHDG